MRREEKRDGNVSTRKDERRSLELVFDLIREVKRGAAACPPRGRSGQNSER